MATTGDDGYPDARELGLEYGLSVGAMGSIGIFHFSCRRWIARDATLDVVHIVIQDHEMADHIDD